jgi:hypothetical protein
MMFPLGRYVRLLLAVLGGYSCYLISMEQKGIIRPIPNYYSVVHSRFGYYYTSQGWYKMVGAGACKGLNPYSMKANSYEQSLLIKDRQLIKTLNLARFNQIYDTIFYCSPDSIPTTILEWLASYAKSVSDTPLLKCKVLQLLNYAKNPKFSSDTA